MLGWLATAERHSGRRSEAPPGVSPGPHALRSVNTSVYQFPEPTMQTFFGAAIAKERTAAWGWTYTEWSWCEPAVRLCNAAAGLLSYWPAGGETAARPVRQAPRLAVHSGKRLVGSVWVGQKSPHAILHTVTESGRHYTGTPYTGPSFFIHLLDLLDKDSAH